MNVLVVGGAGYIGSHMVKFLGRQGCNVVILDDLSHGHRDAVLCGDFIEGNCGDTVVLDQVFKRGIDAVLHFASYIQVGESITSPSAYYRNNFVNTLTLLDAMCAYGVKHLIFSSTAATFGEPLYIPINESHPQNPVNPYGRSKLMIENVLSDFDRAYGLKSIILRYFNAAGSDPDQELGERHEPETHLIPLVLQVAAGKRDNISVFGCDYDTHDGTCVRDYIHVNDLCSAHWLALLSLIDGGSSDAYNLGNGNGFSVKEVIDVAESVTGCSIPRVLSPRRPGDPARLVADSTLARDKLGWTPVYSNLETIIEHAWNWELGLRCSVSPQY